MQDLHLSLMGHWYQTFILTHWDMGTRPAFQPSRMWVLDLDPNLMGHQVLVLHPDMMRCRYWTCTPT